VGWEGLEGKLWTGEITGKEKNGLKSLGKKNREVPPERGPARTERRPQRESSTKGYGDAYKVRSQWYVESPA